MAGFSFAVGRQKQTTKNMKTKSIAGQAMRAARRRMNWTQLDLARRVGCTESLISKLETGRSTPERELKETIANELNIPAWEVGA